MTTSAIQTAREQLSADLRASGLERVYAGWAPSNALDNTIQIVPSQLGVYLKPEAFGGVCTLYMDVLIVAKSYNDPTLAWNWLDAQVVAVMDASEAWDIQGTIEPPALIQGTENLSVTIHLSSTIKLG